ncbi:transcriptional regulator, TetR family [Ruminococcaceae bacterium YRB3002]|nr:transcriptional regulator, TetR family [Ruminococcaceae bacterium YRB3002]
MPKVSEAYIENKRQEIIDATHRLCLRKPVSMITMTDIIAETGMAQGGIYRYFDGVDDILSGLISRMRSRYDMISETDRIMEEAKGKPVRETINSICDLLADRMEQELMDTQKIMFDLNVLAINDPERVERILQGIPGQGNMEYLTSRTAELWAAGMGSGSIHPVMPIGDIVAFIAAAYNGIEMTCILGACYGKGPVENISLRGLFEVYKVTIAKLLGVE